MDGVTTDGPNDSPNDSPLKNVTPAIRDGDLFVALVFIQHTLAVHGLKYLLIQVFADCCTWLL